MLVIPAHVRAYLLMSCLVLSTFMVIPFLSMYLVANTGYRESDLPLIYFTGGAATLVTMSIFGKVSDHYGKLIVCRILVVLAMVPILLITNFDPNILLELLACRQQVTPGSPMLRYSSLTLGMAVARGRLDVFGDDPVHDPHQRPQWCRRWR